MAEMIQDLTKNLFDKRESEVKRPSFESEMEFYQLIREGKVEELREFRKGKLKSNAKERGVLSKNPQRNNLYHFIVMVSLISRFCIEGGLEPDIAYEMSDLYINKADVAFTSEEVDSIREEAIYSFAKTMANLKKKNICSKQIVLCSDFISENIHKNISVTELAAHVKLNETYLSKLFKKEMGLSISEYVREKKVEEAKRLLKYTDKSSIEIATDLGFSSHSYFISVFKKETGETPREYRNKKFRNVWDQE